MTLKLFLADDSVTIQKIINLTFADEDVVIDSVLSGDLALEKVKQFKPDVVLADVFMPGRNGYELCTSIKEDPELSHIPVLLLVGTFEPFDEAEASRVKCDGYLTKPFDTSELTQKIYSLVEKGSAVKHPSVEVSPQTAGDAAALPVSGDSASSVIMESYLGSGRILDLFDPETLSSAKLRPAQPASTGSSSAKAIPLSATKPAAANQSQPISAGRYELTDEDFKIIVDKVIRRMSADIVREVAWEVVPELSEIAIRRSIEERGKL